MRDNAVFQKLTIPSLFPGNATGLSAGVQIQQKQPESRTKQTKAALWLPRVLLPGG